MLLTIMGLVGVASLLLSDLPLDSLPKEVREAIPHQTLRMIILINPALLVVLTTLLGTFLYDKVKLSVPLLEKLLDKAEQDTFSIRSVLLNGVIFGLAAGTLIVLTGIYFKSHLPAVLNDATNSEQLHIATRLLYGGVSEELLTRFGLMSFFAWMIFKVTKKLNSFTYISAIILSAVLFALGHLPLVLQLVPDPDRITYTYVIAGNSVGGLIFGYAYWKSGLECAFIAHAFAHLTMLTLNSLL